MAELYLYSMIMSMSAEMVGREFDMADGEDVTLRINSPGGSVASGWGIAAKMMEYKGKITSKVDGLAASMAGVILPFSDRVEALDVSKIMIHRAVGPNDTEEDRKLLQEVNTNLKQKLAQKIDKQKFKDITGYTLDQIFNEQGERINVWLNAKQAEKVGLVDKVNPLTKKEAQNLSELEQTVMASLNSGEGHTVDNSPQNQNTGNMTYDELKSKHPELFNQVKNEGVNQERERVNSLLVYVDADKDDVVNKIKQGETLTADKREEYTLKLNQKNISSKAENDSPENSEEPEGGDEPETPEAKEIKQFWENTVGKEVNLKES